MIGRNQPCPCLSGSKSKRCCLPLLQGRPAPTPEARMRSRFSAYALGMAEFVLETTHPDSPLQQPDRGQWLGEVIAFSRDTRFLGLEILASSQEGDRGRVHFRARLEQEGRDASFEEDSEFRLLDGDWLYFDGSLRT